jgi:hypothetical protein
MLLANPCCKCRPDGCTYYGDTFDADTIATGAWNDVAGTWSIAGGELSTASTTAVIVWDTNLDDSYQHVYTELNFEALSSKARVVVDYIDSANFCYGEINVEATTITLRVVRVVSGTHTTMASESITSTYTPGMTVVLYVCRTPTGLSANAFYGSRFHAGASHTALGGALAGLATGTNASGVNFEQVVISRHRSGPDYTGCPHCISKCLMCDSAHPLPTSFLVDLSPGGLTDGIVDCSGFDGVVVVDAIPLTSTFCGGTWSESRRWPWLCDLPFPAASNPTPGLVWPAWTALFKKGRDEAGGSAFVYVSCALRFVSGVGNCIEVRVGGQHGTTDPSCIDGTKTLAVFRSEDLGSGILCDEIFPLTLSKVSEDLSTTYASPTRTYVYCNGSFPSTITVDV